jgi:Kef-type K+ transport system membrane component KefB
MEVQNFFLHLLLILLTARIFAELATRLKSPAVIGELLAGVVLGPSVLGWVEPHHAIRLLAEIGIILLLFEVGLGTDVRRLLDTGKQSMVVALSGFMLPLLLGLALGLGVFDLSLSVALFVGGTLTATSIGITVRVLEDLGRLQSSEGQVVLGAAVLDDIMGVVLLAILFESSMGGGVTVMNVGKVLVFIAAFFILAPVAARLISVVIRHFDGVSGLPGLIPTTIVSLVLFFAWMAQVMGAPQLLGGFAAGLALSRRFFLPFGVALHADEAFAARIETQMKPIIQLFTPIFFVVVGLSLNLHEIDWGSPFIWVFSMSMLAVALVGKMVGPLFIRESWPLRWMIGVAMVPRGEVGLIFAELGRAGGIFSNEIYAALVIVIALTTLLPPLVMKGSYALLRKHFPSETPLNN